MREMTTKKVAATGIVCDEYHAILVLVENDLSDTMVADDGTDEIDPAATHEDGWTTVHHTKRKRPQIRKQFKANSVSAL